MSGRACEVQPGVTALPNDGRLTMDHLPEVALKDGTKVQTGTAARLVLSINDFNELPAGAVNSQQVLLACMETAIVPLSKVGLLGLFSPDEWIGDGSNPGRSAFGHMYKAWTMSSSHSRVEVPQDPISVSAALVAAMPTVQPHRGNHDAKEALPNDGRLTMDHLPEVALKDGTKVQTGTAARLVLSINDFNELPAGDAKARQVLLANMETAIAPLSKVGLLGLFSPDEWIGDGWNPGRSAFGHMYKATFETIE